MKRIGLTSTIPVEVIFAAGLVPVDLNNIFITSQTPADYVTRAEYEGYPRNSCGWVKGIYSVAIEGDFDAVITVVEGDCSQTQAMAETFEMNGLCVIPFSYPYKANREALAANIHALADRLGAKWDDVVEWKYRLDRIREKVWRLDEISWQMGTVSSFDNHYYQICCSDFNGDPNSFEKQVDLALDDASHRKPVDGDVLRLGYIGIPPIFTDFYEYVESLGVRIVLNEVQRQFSMPFRTKDIVEQYGLYTYPYDIFGRLEDIKHEISQRRIEGLIHYTQSFCFRQIQDLIIRRKIDLPILTLEGDAPTLLDARTKVRLESFVEMLR